MNTLKNKTIFITGASRGIGRAIALKCAADGANIVIAAKSAEPHPKLPGTIFSVAKEVEEAGGQALPLQLDVRDTDQIQTAVQAAAAHFGGIDVLVNNAGAIRLTSTDATTPKSFDLMMSVNTRATYFCSQACLPYLEKSSGAHILNLSPPISFEPKWLQNNIAYTITKYGMSLCTAGMAAEFRDKNISVNSLWPRTAIWTAAIDMLMGEAAMEKSRKPEIIADAAHALFLTPGGQITGQWLLDDDFLKEHCGVTNFDAYACAPGATDFIADFFVN